MSTLHIFSLFCFLSNFYIVLFQFILLFCFLYSLIRNFQKFAHSFIKCFFLYSFSLLYFSLILLFLFEFSFLFQFFLNLLFLSQLFLGFLLYFGSNFIFYILFLVFFYNLQFWRNMGVFYELLPPEFLPPLLNIYPILLYWQD